MATFEWSQKCLSYKGLTVLSRVSLTISINKHKMIFTLFSIMLDYFYCIMQLDPLSYDKDRNLSASTFIRLHYKNFKNFLKTMKKNKNFRGIYKKLFYGISIHYRTPFCKILWLIKAFLFLFVVPSLWSKSLKNNYDGAFW